MLVLNKPKMETATDKTTLSFFKNILETALDEGLAHMHFGDYLKQHIIYRKRDTTLQKMKTSLEGVVAGSSKHGRGLKSLNLYLLTVFKSHLCIEEYY